MDLGNILGGVRDAVDTYRYVTGDMPSPQAQSFAGNPLAGLGDVPVSNVPVSQRASISQKGKGCRRRRRRLLTKSDLGDIAALKGIVGTGKNFENILAAAMYRSR